MAKFKRGDLVKYKRSKQVTIILVTKMRDDDPDLFQGVVVRSEIGQLGWYSEYWAVKNYSKINGSLYVRGAKKK